jgi:hypothetical protein
MGVGFAPRQPQNLCASTPLLHLRRLSQSEKQLHQRLAQIVPKTSPRRTTYGAMHKRAKKIVDPENVL